MLLVLHFEPSTALVYVDLIFHYLFCLDVLLNLMVKTHLPKVSLGLDTEVLGLHFKHVHLPLNLHFFHFLPLVLLPQNIGFFSHMDLLDAGHSHALIFEVEGLLFLYRRFQLVPVHFLLQSTELQVAFEPVLIGLLELILFFLNHFLRFFDPGIDPVDDGVLPHVPTHLLFVCGIFDRIGDLKMLLTVLEFELAFKVLVSHLPLLLIYHLRVALVFYLYFLQFLRLLLFGLCHGLVYCLHLRLHYLPVALLGLGREIGIESFSTYQRRPQILSSLSLI